MMNLLGYIRLFSIYAHSLLKFKLTLVGAESRISKQSTEQDLQQCSELCKRLKMCEDLSEERCSWMCVEK